MSTPQRHSFRETPDTAGAYPRLTAEQIAALTAGGERRSTDVGEVLFREGERTSDFVVVLDGAVAIVEGYGRPDERVVSVHGPGLFLGELGVLTGQAAFVTATVLEPGAVLIVSVDRLRQVVTQDVALGDLILRAYVLRRPVTCVAARSSGWHPPWERAPSRYALSTSALT